MVSASRQSGSPEERVRARVGNRGDVGNESRCRARKAPGFRRSRSAASRRNLALVRARKLCSARQPWRPDVGPIEFPLSLEQETQWPLPAVGLDPLEEWLRPTRRTTRSSGRRFIPRSGWPCCPPGRRLVFRSGNGTSRFTDRVAPGALELGRVPGPPSRDYHQGHPLRHQVVQLRHGLGRGVGGYAAGGSRQARGRARPLRDGNADIWSAGSRRSAIGCAATQRHRTRAASNSLVSLCRAVFGRRDAPINASAAAAARYIAGASVTPVRETSQAATSGVVPPSRAIPAL